MMASEWLILRLGNGRDQWNDWMVLMVFSVNLTLSLGALSIKALLPPFQVTSNLPHDIVEHTNGSFPGSCVLLLFRHFVSLCFVEIPDGDRRLDGSDHLVIALTSRFSTQR